MVVGYQINKHNCFYHHAPIGRIRIARFTSSFWPQMNKGYYGEIYMLRMIRKWKKQKKELEIAIATESLIKRNICDDLIMEIVKYL
jgi:hypothetical protein